eukprot:COSAG02_NODE_48228_length_335_cov_0.872881_1_plen_35_part_10
MKAIDRYADRYVAFECGVGTLGWVAVARIFWLASR